MSLTDVEVTNTSNPNKSILYQPSSIANIGLVELKRNTGLYLEDRKSTRLNSSHSSVSRMPSSA